MRYEQRYLNVRIGTEIRERGQICATVQVDNRVSCFAAQTPGEAQELVERQLILLSREALGL